MKRGGLYISPQMTVAMESVKIFQHYLNQEIFLYI